MLPYTGQTNIQKENIQYLSMFISMFIKDIINFHKIGEMPKIKHQQSFRVIFQRMKLSTQLILINKFVKAQKILQSVLHIHPQYANALYLYSICLQNQQLLLMTQQQAQKNRERTKNKKQLCRQLKQKAFQLNQQFYTRNNKDVKQICQKILKLIEQNKNRMNIFENLNLLKRIYIVDQYVSQKDYNTASFIMKMSNLITNKQINIDEFLTQHQSNSITNTSQNTSTENKIKDQVISHYGLKYYQLAEYRKSMHMYKIAIVMSPQDPMYYHNMALLCYVLQDYAKSQQYILRTLQIETRRPKSYYLQAFIYMKTNRLIEAYNKIHMAINLCPQQIIYYIKMITTIFIIHHQSFSCGKKKEDSPQNQQQIRHKCISIGNIDNILNFIRKSAQIMQNEQNINKGAYFVGKEYFRQFIKFISLHIQFYYKLVSYSTSDTTQKINNSNYFIYLGIKKMQLIEQYKSLWIKYMLLLDDYLIKGSYDKFKIKKQMNQIVLSITQLHNIQVEPQHCEQVSQKKEYPQKNLSQINANQFVSSS